MSEGTASARRILDGIRAEQSAIERSQREFMDSVGHPADREQGRGMDPVAHRRGLFAPIVDGAMYCVIRMAEALMSDQDAQPAKPLKAKPLPDLEQREAASFYEGWWLGSGVGFVIGAGLMAVILPVLGAA